jgi:hypothetical protein
MTRTVLMVCALLGDNTSLDNFVGALSQGGYRPSAVGAAPACEYSAKP